ncbi:hypothetical protein NE237_008795 [Protea cynaroides]|uniref:Uncharacterized protein n=1 Tax=Protea cynaroides TaxID=273540 RepID=A0A9Q0R043_9MAGN|nr:hypothetical protein NE237_008795 [Protea cynaroides]
MSSASGGLPSAPGSRVVGVSSGYGGGAGSNERLFEIHLENQNGDGFQFTTMESRVYHAGGDIVTKLQQHTSVALPIIVAQSEGRFPDLVSNIGQRNIRDGDSLHKNGSGGDGSINNVSTVIGGGPQVSQGAAGAVPENGLASDRRLLAMDSNPCRELQVYSRGPERSMHLGVNNQMPLGGQFPLSLSSNMPTLSIPVQQTLLGGGGGWSPPVQQDGVSHGDNGAGMTPQAGGGRTMCSSLVRSVGDLGRFLGFPCKEPVVIVGNSRVDIGSRDRVAMNNRQGGRKRRQWTAKEKGKIVSNVTESLDARNSEFPQGVSNASKGVRPVSGLRSFVDVATGFPDLNSLHDPMASGGITRVVLPQAVVDRQMAKYQLALIGRCGIGKTFGQIGRRGRSEKDNDVEVEPVGDGPSTLLAPQVPVRLEGATTSNLKQIAALSSPVQ